MCKAEVVYPGDVAVTQRVPGAFLEPSDLERRGSIEEGIGSYVLFCYFRAVEEYANDAPLIADSNMMPDVRRDSDSGTGDKRRRCTIGAS